MVARQAASLVVDCCKIAAVGRQSVNRRLFCVDERGVVIGQQVVETRC